MEGAMAQPQDTSSRVSALATPGQGSARYRASATSLRVPSLNTGVWRLAVRWWLLPVAGAFLAGALCLLLAHESGFPLDDSWIHQDFARTLATTGHFAYLPGRGGAGSTSPGWVLLLVPPQLLTHGQPPLWMVVGWAALLGAGALAGLGVLTGLTAGELARRTGADARVFTLAAGLGGASVVMEWHLVWAAASGMETDLFALLALALILGASRGVRPLLLGLLAGITVTVRPEGAVAAALVVAGAAWSALNAGTSASRDASRARTYLTAGSLERLGNWTGRWLLPFAVGALVASMPYLLLNLSASGQLLPSTVVAKNAAWSGDGGSLSGVLSYLADTGTVLVASSPVLLLLSALAAFRWLLDRSGGARHTLTTPRHAPNVGRAYPLAAVLWVWPIALVALYAGHMSGAFYYGRYQMPGLPALMALGAAGTAHLLLDGRRRALAAVAALALASTSVFSLVRGSQIHAENVRYIDAVEVDTSLWLRAHTPPGALVATHDVGAIGYFSDRPVLDMAGLVDPQVVPLLGDQRALEAYLARRHMAYVAMWDTWFPTVAHDLAARQVYHARGAAGFVVYRTGW
jgi:hypothetical protein